MKLCIATAGEVIMFGCSKVSWICYQEIDSFSSSETRCQLHGTVKETNTDNFNSLYSLVMGYIQIKCDEKMRCFGERILEGSYRPMLKRRGVEGVCGGGEDDFHKECLLYLIKN